MGIRIKFHQLAIYMFMVINIKSHDIDEIRIVQNVSMYVCMCVNHVVLSLDE